MAQVGLEMHLEQYQERNEAAKCFEDDLDFCPSLTPREVSEFKLASILAHKERRNKKQQQQQSSHSSPTLSTTPSPRTSRAISIVDPVSGAPLFMPRAISPPSPTSSVDSVFSSENTPFGTRRTSSLGSSPPSSHFSSGLFPPGFDSMGLEYFSMSPSRQKQIQHERQQEQLQQQQLELDAMYQQQEFDSMYQQQMDAMYAYQFSGPFSSMSSQSVWGSTFPIEMVMMGPPSPVYAPPSHLPPPHMARVQGSWHQSFVAVR